MAVEIQMSASREEKLAILRELNDQLKSRADFLQERIIASGSRPKGTPVVGEGSDI